MINHTLIGILIFIQLNIDEFLWQPRPSHELFGPAWKYGIRPKSCSGSNYDAHDSSKYAIRQ